VAYSDVTISGYAASSSLSAITGTTLTASTGGVDVRATKGKVTVRTISARTPSIIKLDDGSLAVSSILALTRPNLTVQVQGGTSTLPRGF
jgi:predicted anti-sigma-YlaC factor YlaD